MLEIEESSLSNLMEESLYEMLIANLIKDLETTLNLRNNSDGELERKQKSLLKILLDDKSGNDRSKHLVIVSWFFFCETYPISSV